METMGWNELSWGYDGGKWQVLVQWTKELQGIILEECVEVKL